MSRTRSIFCAKYLLSARGQSNNGADNNNDDIGKDDDVDNDDNDGNDEPNSKMFAGSLVISTSRKRKIESVAPGKNLLLCVTLDVDDVHDLHDVLDGDDVHDVDAKNRHCFDRTKTTK